MIQGLLGKKIGMSRYFDTDGNSIPVTLISCGPCYVVSKNDSIIQLGYEEVKESKLNKAQTGYLKKRNLPSLKHLKNVDWYGKQEESPEVGSKLSVDIFQEGDIINVQGISKGKGTTGVMKRWGFKGGPGRSGSQFHRLPGSIGQAASPSRVFPGLKMAGRKGADVVKVKNLMVVSIDTDENIIAVKGAVPGPAKGLLFIERKK